MPRDAAAGRPRGEGRPAFVIEGVPLHYQLGSVLREKILSGQLGAGQRIPTEAALSADYGVSRITVRQALAAIESEGLIRREAGRGSFVSEKLSSSALSVQGSLHDLITMAAGTSVQLVDLRTTEAGPEQAAALQVAVGARLTRATHLRFHHGEPFSFSVSLLPLELGRRLERRDRKPGSVLKRLARFGHRISGADQTVRAALADATLARLLKTRIGAPLLVVDRVVHAGGRPIESTRTYYRGDLFSIRAYVAHEPERTASARGSLRRPSASSRRRRGRPAPSSRS